MVDLSRSQNREGVIQVAKVGNEAKLILRLAEEKAQQAWVEYRAARADTDSPAHIEQRKGFLDGITCYREILHNVVYDLESSR